MIDLESLSKEVCDISRETGKYILAEQENFSKKHVVTKDLNSLVSYVDQEAERMIVAALSPLIDGAGFITEEGTASKNGKYQWVIDPLDGTTNFIHGLPCYSVSIGLLEDDIPVLGVVYEINQDEMFDAFQGGGSRLNGQPIHVSETEMLADGLMATGFPYYDFSKADAYLGILNELIRGTRGIRRFGSAAVDLAYVACGRFDVFYEHSLNSWDVCAGIVLVQEAGGVLKDFKGGEDYLHGAEIIATNKMLLSPVEHIISRHWN